MRRFLLMAALVVAATNAHAGPVKPASTYDELRRNLGNVSSEAITAVRLGGAAHGSASGAPDPAHRARLEALCGREKSYWLAFGRHAVASSKPLTTVGPRARHEPTYEANGKLQIALNFNGVLPNQLRTLADQPLHAGQARFLKPGESLRAKPTDTAAALRQRAEWLVLLDALTRDLDRARIASGDDFNATYALGVWTSLKCDLGRRSGDLIRAHLAVDGYPLADDPDTESAFVLLVGATADPSVAALALEAGRARTPSLSPQLEATFERWSRPRGGPVEPSNLSPDP